MPAPLSALARERLRLYFRIAVLSALIGAVYGLLQGEGRSGIGLLYAVAISMANGAAVSLAIGGIEIFLLQEGAAMRRLLALPFIAVFALKFLVYGAIVTGVMAVSQRVGAPLDSRAQLITIGFSLLMTALFVVTLQAAGLIGRRTFRDLVLGRYRRPRAERRFFLFVDVVGSTAIAERLGPLQAHRFLSAVFSAVAEPASAAHGEIHQYVGDEIVLTWTEDEGRPDARPLRCYFGMMQALQERAAEFRARFGAEPALRAALHLGEVIAGEVGESRRAIVFHGDVMNTAARLEQATREHGRRFIASAEALAAFGPLPEFELHDLGALQLRGRREPIAAVAVDLKR